MTREDRKQEHRLRRQFRAVGRLAPGADGVTESLLHRRMRLLRAPLGVLLVLGGVFSFLPVLGIWMLPLGLLLLAVDFPFLRPRVSAAVIRSRRRASLWRRWLWSRSNSG
ncbi:tryptophan synthase subunit beta [Amaricoccus sp.]|uniref:tryptophan synthase subunit beta n=1 Tax=Amaricoccus sp. TaxID=1872485 RepID=UPI001B6E65B4|nr:tryptophan synthase subunit beta [Amaricoccus sp.]MBP7001972.1 tryptophan synthase subunit beta [Amaricoccus sp.]